MTLIILLWNLAIKADGACVGRFTNPITDVCWKCLFPIKIAGINVTLDYQVFLKSHDFVLTMS